MRLIPRYESLVYDGGRTLLSVADGLVTLTWDSGLPTGTEIRPLNEVIVAGWLSFGRWIAAESATQITEIEFKHQAPENTAEYDRFFACPVRCGRTQNSLTAPLSVMQQPLIQQDDELRILMEQQAEALMARLDPTDAFTQRVITCIQNSLPHRTPSSEDTAQLLHVSERSLRRKLSSEGTSYKELLARVRRNLADHYVQKSSMSMLEIALLLGYSNQSSFNSAFRQWFECSPREMRKRHSH